MSKPKKAHELIKNNDIAIPWHVSRFLNSKYIRIAGDQACITDEGDYGSVEELLTSLEWLVDQFGGTVVRAKKDK